MNALSLSGFIAFLIMLGLATVTWETDRAPGAAWFVVIGFVLGVGITTHFVT